ncbi:hypothetical protein C3Y89_32320 [Rhizobium sp. UPM1132]|nr:hypothetical protein [Rhizobium ruizarguesonis]NKQ82046.1 hypothetical protein [Rhizobium ruizarguesonis]
MRSSVKPFVAAMVERDNHPLHQAVSTRVTITCELEPNASFDIRLEMRPLRRPWPNGSGRREEQSLRGVSFEFRYAWQNRMFSGLPPSSRF